MTTPINARDISLQATEPRVLQVSSNYLVLNSTSLQFKYGTDNLPQPSQAIVTASLIGKLEGEVVFSTTGFITPPPLDPSNPNKLIIDPANFTGDFVTISASVNWQGASYQAVPVSITKVLNQLTAKVTRPVDLIPSYNDGTGYTLPDSNNYIELYNGVVKLSEGITYGPAAQTANGLTVNVNTSTGQITLSQTAWVASNNSFTVNAIRNNISYNTTYTITKAKAGAGGIQTKELALYRWSVGLPAIPSGSSVYTWTTDAHVYNGGDSWSLTPSANPGTVGIALWKATKSVIAEASLVTTQISANWTGATVRLVTTEANEVLKTRTVTVYRNDTSMPSITGTSTLTWNTGVFTAPNNWNTTAPARAPGQILYSAEVLIQAATAQTTSTIDWTQSSILPISYYGTDGAAARRAYVVVTTTPTSTPSTYIATGDNLPTTGTWFAGKTWSSTAPTAALLEGETVYQSDGVYVANGNTTWGFPYISTLKVGNLQAISANTGTLTVTGSIRGGLATAQNIGTGYYLGSDGKFRVGQGTGSRLEWDGNGLVIYNSSNTAILSAGQLQWSAVTGATKPQDNATAGAPANTYVGTVLAQDLVTSVSNKLSKNSASILSATISLDATSGAGFVAGNLTWNALGQRTGGSGVAMTPGGLVGYNPSGINTFGINASTGDVVITGKLTSADGKFVIDTVNKTISITV